MCFSHRRRIDMGIIIRLLESSLDVWREINNSHLTRSSKLPRGSPKVSSWIAVLMGLTLPAMVKMRRKEWVSSSALRDSGQRLNGSPSQV